MRTGSGRRGVTGPSRPMPRTWRGGRRPRPRGRPSLIQALVRCSSAIVSSGGSAASNRSSAAPPRSRKRSSPAASACSSDQSYLRGPYGWFLTRCQPGCQNRAPAYPCREVEVRGASPTGKGPEPHGGFWAAHSRRATARRAAAWPPRWSSRAACAHAVVVSVLITAPDPGSRSFPARRPALTAASGSPSPARSRSSSRALPASGARAPV